MSFFSDLFSGWFGISYSSLPRWVKKVHSKWERRYPVTKINIKKTFVGKTFLYQVRYGSSGMQGEDGEESWYRKKRKRIGKESKKLENVSAEDRRREIAKTWAYVNNHIDLGVGMDEKVVVYVGKDGKGRYKIVKDRKRRRRRKK